MPGPFDTVMGGLRCGEMSPLAFPVRRESLVDAYVAIEDDWAFEAMRLLARPARGGPAGRVRRVGRGGAGGLLAR